MSTGFNVLTADAASLQAKLAAGELTSHDVVAAYIQQIERHNLAGMALRAVISVAPQVLAQARDLDDERKSRGPRGPLHGIPILLKDTILTKASLGLDTTCGTHALIGARGKENAAVVELLIKAGAIIIGKAHLSELGLLKAVPPNTSGWGSAFGQCLSPYVRGGVLQNATFLGQSTPAGSSSGSAVGVAAGFTPLSIGAETDGSLVQPASRAGLYALKPGPGAVDLSGVMPLGPKFDCVGAITRSARDMANITGLLMGQDFSGSLKVQWKDLALGFVPFQQWAPAPFVVEHIPEFEDEVVNGIHEAAQKIAESSGKVVMDVPLANFADLVEYTKATYNVDPEDLWTFGFRQSFTDYLQLYETSNIRSLEELIEYNKEHADICLPPDHPSQEFLEILAKAPDDPDFDKKRIQVQNEARKRIDTALAADGLDAILAFGDGRMASLASAAGYAVASLPLGYGSFNGRGWGVNAIAGKDGEAKLLQLMNVWEATFPNAVRPPPQLLHQPSL